MFINFNVSNMKLTVKMPNNIVSHSQDYLKAHFNFLTDDWQDKDKVAYFSMGEPNEENLPFAVALDENGECTIPKEKISEPGYLYIGVGGTDLTVDLPTNYVKFKLTEGVDFTGDEGSTPTPSLIAQMWEVVNEAKEIAQNGGGTGTGADGFSPIATVEKVGDTATITITDKNGTTTATVTDGVGGTSDLTLEDYSPVAKPILSVTGSCNFTSSLNITMTTDRPCDIYYTLDGSTPTILSAKYTTSFTITDSKRIKAFAVDSNGVSSDVITTSYLNNNDVTAPVITINPVSKSFSDTQEVEITLNETGVIQYTLDGSTPTFNSQRYNGKIKLSNTTTLKVMARDPLGNTSAVKTETYTKTTADITAPILTITPSGNFDTTQTVTMSVNETATIYYTTDGSAPTESSNVYSAPLSLSATTTVKAFAKDTAGNSSTVRTVTYTKNATDTTAPVLTISPSGGNFTTSQSVTMSTNETAIIYYTLDGSAPTTSSAVYSGAITLNSTTTLKAFAKDTSGNSSVVQTVIYTKNISSDVTAPIVTASPIGGMFENSQNVELITDEQATIYYTTDGSAPTESSNVYDIYGSGIPITKYTVLKYFAKDTSGNISSTGVQTYDIVAAYDSFSRLDNTSLGATELGSKTWVEMVNQPDGTVFNYFNIVNSKVQNSNASSNAYALIDAGQYNNVEISVDVTIGTGTAFGGLMFRYNGMTNYQHDGFYFIYHTAVGSKLGKWVNSTGTTAVLGNNTSNIPTTGQTYNLKIRLVGDNIKCFINDVLQFDVIDNYKTGLGNVGFYTQNDGTTLFDNFKVSKI